MLNCKRISKFFPSPPAVLHFIGIGGIGMSGLAELMYHFGYTVQGSDVSENENVHRLRKKGIRVFIGHDSENVKNATLVVLSSAIKFDNLERISTLTQNIPLLSRGELLSSVVDRYPYSIAVGGSHGKTTTTSLIAHILETSRLQPTVIGGGILNAYDSNVRLGFGEFIVVESDESDASFTLLSPSLAVVTNIEPEHLDHYKNFDALLNAFLTFLHNTPAHNPVILCHDHPHLQTLRCSIKRPVISYGLSPHADIYAHNISFSTQHAYFDVTLNIAQTSSQTLQTLSLPLLGFHNIQNALAATAIAHTLQISPQTIRQALHTFPGVRRRFTHTGETNHILIVDDYAHHPTEIYVTLQASKLTNRRHTIAVFQPHRYSRLAQLFTDFCTCFTHADTIIVADVYPAGEPPIPHYNQKTLTAGIQKQTSKPVIPLKHPSHLPHLIAEIAQPNDIVVCLGAGSITSWAHSLPQQLDRLLNTS